MLKIKPIGEKRNFLDFLSISVIKMLFDEVREDERQKRELLQELHEQISNKERLYQTMLDKRQKLVQAKATIERRIEKLNAFRAKLESRSLTKENLESEFLALINE